MPALVEWLDRTSAGEQRRIADGLSCPYCEALTASDVPLMQYRRADVVGLVVGLPARSAASDDEAFIRDVIAAAHNASDLEGAAVVVSIRMAWWGSVWNRPLGPPLIGAQPVVLPESDDETQRWRMATLAALELPDIRAALRDFVTSADKQRALEVGRQHPELLSPRWRLTVDVLLAQLKDAQQDLEAARAVDARAALLRQARLLGLDAAGEPTPPEIEELIAAATRTSDSDERLAALRSLIDPHADPSVPGIAARLALVETLHGHHARRFQEDAALLGLARETVELAEATLGEDHPMTHAARSNLAVVVDERSDVDREAAMTEAEAILTDLAPRAARMGSTLLADIATNLATIAATRPGSRADNPEEASELLADAAHLGALLSSDRRRDVLIELVDAAAALRSRVSGSRRVNAAQALELAREAQRKEDRWRVLSDPERVLLRTNIANALTQLHQRAPREAPLEAVAQAAQDTLLAAADLGAQHPVGIQAGSNAGATLTDLYVETLKADQPDVSLWTQARDALESAFDAAKMALPAHHRLALVAASNLASVYGSVVDGQVADRGRCAALLEYVLENAQPAEADVRLAAASNLAQLRIGSGDWPRAAEAYAAAADAQQRLFSGARTYVTRLGEIVAAGDLAARRALALVGSGRLAEAVDVLESNRARLARPSRWRTSDQFASRRKTSGGPPGHLCLRNAGRSTPSGRSPVRVPDAADCRPGQAPPGRAARCAGC